MNTIRHDREQGSIMVGLLVILMAVGGLAAILLTRSSRSSSAAAASAELARLLYVVEAGINLNYADMEIDATYVVKDTARFTWNDTTKEFESGAIALQADSDSVQRSYSLAVQYRNVGLPVTFADRLAPSEAIDEIIVRCEASSSRGKRAVTATYEFTGYAIGGAIMSDMIPTGPATGGGRKIGQAGHISFTGDDERDEFHVYGDIIANGSVIFVDKKDGEVNLDGDNASKYFASYRGTNRTKLAGTDDEIPDFTAIGSDKQLFDFRRFEAAAKAGAGVVYNDSASFNTAMNIANSMGRPLEGIHYVKIDPSGSNPDFDEPIHIIGTFVVDFADGTDPFEKIQALEDFSVNPADLSGVIPSDESTFTSGYPGKYTDLGLKPSSVDISPAFENFREDEDTPALMYNNGVLDIHGSTNICGVVYGASFLEIENKKKLWHYFNGAMYAGGGIWFAAGGEDDSATMIRWDSNTVDDLDTATVGTGTGSTGGKELIEKSYSRGK